jgi:hypothetical protein
LVDVDRLMATGCVVRYHGYVAAVVYRGIICRVCEGIDE